MVEASRSVCRKKGKIKVIKGIKNDKEKTIDREAEKKKRSENKKKER